MNINNLSLKWKGLLIIILCLLGMSLQVYMSATDARKAMVHEKQMKLKEVVKVAYDNVAKFDSLIKAGELSEEEGRKLAKAVLRNVKYNELNDYFFAFTYDGVTQVHGEKASLEGKNLIELKDPNGVVFVADLIKVAKQGGGFVDYVWERDGVNVPKLSYAMAYKPWGWMIGTGIYVDDIDAAHRKNVIEALKMVSLVLLIVAGFTWFIIKSIISPIMATSDQMTKISNNEEVEITGTERKDELGGMARTLGELKVSVEEQRRLEKEMAEAEIKKKEDQKKAMNDMADGVENKVGTVVTKVEDAATEMQRMAETLAAASEETIQQSSSVANSSELASTNVQTVAAAAEELSASIKDLVANVSDTAKATRACSDAAQVSQEYLNTLQSSVDEIDGVIKSITDVAEQTNLLALNATIEAARAGDAGKGFAVIAQEVKALASETNKMTDEIAGKIDTIKSSAADTIHSVEDIVSQIASVDERTASISSAIEEQNASTSEISRSAQDAANFTNEVSSSITQVQTAAEETASSTGMLKNASDGLAEQSTVLKDTVASFVKEVRST